jgi:hypothetical protein
MDIIPFLLHLHLSLPPPSLLSFLLPLAMPAFPYNRASRMPPLPPMLLSPYFFDEPDPLTPFHKAVGDYKAWYFWAQVLEMGTALAHTTVSTASDGIIYFIIDPSLDNHPCISPEDFLDILTGYEDAGKFWGYAWTIQEMANNWHCLIQGRYQGQPYNVNDYALKINHAIQKVDIVPKTEIWKGIEEISF